MDDAVAVDVGVDSGEDVPVDDDGGVVACVADGVRELESVIVDVAVGDAMNVFETDREVI